MWHREILKKSWLIALLLALVALDLSTVREIDGKRAQVLPEVNTQMLAEAQVAIVTTAGLRTDGDTYWAPGDQAFTEIPVDADKLALAHFSPNFDRSGFMADPEVVFPVKRLAELAADGTIGSVAPLHYSFMGAQPDHNLETMRLDSGPACAERLKRDGTDIVVLTPI